MKIAPNPCACGITEANGTHPKSLCSVVRQRIPQGRDACLLPKPCQLPSIIQENPEYLFSPFQSDAQTSNQTHTHSDAPVTHVWIM